MTVVGSDLPPEIYEIVEAAGRDNVFWWSNRFRQGRKPDVGSAASEMTNTVPGSSITATQGTGSAQPISDNRGYSLEGDDHLVSSGHRADFDEGVTHFFAVTNRATADNTVLISQAINTSRDDPSYDVRMDGDTQIDSRFHDGATDLRPTLGSIDNTTIGVVAARTQISGGVFSAQVWYRGVGGTSTQAAQTSSTESDFAADVRHIGQRVKSSAHLDAIIHEMLCVEQALSDDMVEQTLDRIWWRHQ